VARANEVTVALDDRELRRQLNQLEDKVAGDKSLRNALVSGARPMAKEAKELAPVDTGELKKSIGVRTRKVARWGYEASVAARTYYAHLVEFGVAPHFIGRKSKAGKRTLWRKIHPGHTARPFLRPAFDTKKSESVDKTRQRLREVVDKVAAQGGRP
jgi:HK97 gp10 family phage protein